MYKTVNSFIYNHCHLFMYLSFIYQAFKCLYSLLQCL